MYSDLTDAHTGTSIPMSKEQVDSLDLINQYENEFMVCCGMLSANCSCNHQEKASYQEIYPWASTFDSPYKNITSQGCRDCIFFNTVACEPYQNWFTDDIYSDDTSLNDVRKEYITPCSSYVDFEYPDFKDVEQHIHRLAEP